MQPEHARLLKMLKEHKITAADYKILAAALKHKTSALKTIIALLINPFKKIAGIQALLIGLVIIIGMSYLGSVTKLYYSAILDITNAAEILHPKLPLSFAVLLYQNVLAWVLVSIIYVIAAKILQPKKTRIIDFIGTVALARYPYLIFTCLMFITQLFIPNVLQYDVTKGYSHPTTSLMLLGLIFSVCSLWQLAAYFFAFKESSGLTHKKLWIGFVVAMFIGEVISLRLAQIFM